MLQMEKEENENKTFLEIMQEADDWVLLIWALILLAIIGFTLLWLF